MMTDSPKLFVGDHPCISHVDFEAMTIELDERDYWDRVVEGIGLDPYWLREHAHREVDYAYRQHLATMVAFGEMSETLVEDRYRVRWSILDGLSYVDYEGLTDHYGFVLEMTVTPGILETLTA